MRIPPHLRPIVTMLTEDPHAASACRVRREKQTGPDEAGPETMLVVETKGIEPSASAMRRQRSPS